MPGTGDRSRPQGVPRIRAHKQGDALLDIGRVTVTTVGITCSSILLLLASQPRTTRSAPAIPLNTGLDMLRQTQSIEDQSRERYPALDWDRHGNTNRLTCVRVHCSELCRFIPARNKAAAGKLGGRRWDMAYASLEYGQPCPEFARLPSRGAGCRSLPLVSLQPLLARSPLSLLAVSAFFSPQLSYWHKSAVPSGRSISRRRSVETDNCQPREKLPDLGVSLAELSGSRALAGPLVPSFW